MKYLFLILSFLILCVSCKEQTQEFNPEINESFGDSTDVSVSSYDYNSFKEFLEKKDDKVHVVNFWATWCKPCVEELPYFEMINEHYADDEVEVLLVTLDMPSMVDNHVIPFIKKHKIMSDVVLLDDPDSNFWIRDIDEAWTGAIPATIIYKNDKRKFYEQTFTFNELQQELKTFL